MYASMVWFFCRRRRRQALVRMGKCNGNKNEGKGDAKREGRVRGKDGVKAAVKRFHFFLAKRG